MEEKKYFVGVSEQDDNGFMMIHCGRSNDGKNHVVTTNQMHSTDVADLCPEVADAKSCAELVAKLLNEYYSQQFITPTS